MTRTLACEIALAAAIASAGVAGEGLSVGKPFNVTPDLAQADQRWPAVAYGNDVYLVVWQEGEAMAGVKDTNIHAARVSADGQPLDPKGFVVCAAAGFQTYPAVAFDGTHFIVAWQDYRNTEDWDVYAARVTPDGKVLDADGFAVAAVLGNQIYPTLASDGKVTFAAWSDVRPTNPPELYRLYGTFIRDGKPVEPNGKELARGAASLLLPYTRWDGEGFPLIANLGVTGWEPGAPFATRVGLDGKVQSWNMPAFRSQTYALASDAASGKSLVWGNSRIEHGSYSVVYATSLQSAKGDAGLRQIVLGLQSKHPPRNDLWCAAVHDGKNFVAVVEQSPALGGEPKGNVPVSVELAITRFDTNDGTALDAGSYRIPDSLKGDLRAAIHSKECGEAAKTAKPGIRIAEGPDVQLRHPALASAGGGRSLLVYSRHGGLDDFRIRATVLSE